MQIVTETIFIENEKFLLTNQRALFWEQESALVLSDLHIGKTAHFRKNGIAIPKNVLKKDLYRLEALINCFAPSNILINGDLIHAGYNSDVEEFCKFKQRFPMINYHLIQGNHDRLTKDIRENLSLDSIQGSLQIRNILLTHEFDNVTDKFQINGHIHPGILLKTPIKNIKLPCFAVSERQMLLPAYSEFTGLDVVNIPKRSDFYIFTDEIILKV